MKNISLLVLVLIAFGFSACNAEDPGTVINYYAEAGILTPSFKAKSLNKHVAYFKSLYNELGIVVDATAKESVPDLSKSFANWTLKTTALRQDLSADEKQKLDNYVEKITKAWKNQEEALNKSTK